MISVVVGIHVTVCLVLCLIILLQQGKGADVGAVFGGSSQTMFGSNTQGNAMTRATYILATLFFATSIFLAYTGARRVTGSIFEGPFSSGRSSVMPTKQLPKVPAPAVPGGGAAPASKK
jgi:preprotein translocase subunit SecG